jgi:small-conductance mechanosensitive channel
MEALAPVFDTVFLDNTVWDWLLAAAVFGATFLVIPFVSGRIRARQDRWQGRENSALELLSLLMKRTSKLVLLSIALYFAENILKLPARVDRVFDVIIVVGIAIQFALWASTAMRFFLQRHHSRAGGHESARAPVGALVFIGQLLIWGVFALLALDNLGVNITALVAGLGVGGIAIALAVQTILGDLFGSMSIALDKPFTIGDSLRIDDIEGTVEQIGIKSTRLRSVTGEQIILSNADVLKSRVRNMGRMPERRVLFRLRLAYDTSAEDLAKVSGLVEKVVTSQPRTRFVHCLLNELGVYAIEFEVIYFIDNTDGQTARTVDAINRGILGSFAAEKIGFAYPTQRALTGDNPNGSAAPRESAPA